MNGLTLRDLLIRLDTAPFNGPVCLCLDQALAAADEGDFLLMAALANLGRDVAKECGDATAEATFCIYLALARQALGDSAAAEELLQRAKRGLRRFPGAAARQNEAIASVVLGALDESKRRNKRRTSLRDADGVRAMGWYSDALSLLQQACRAHAERGDRKAHSLAAEVCQWVEKRIDSLVPRVYVDGDFESRDASFRDWAQGINGTRPVSTARDEDSIRYLEGAGAP
jgi:hypothetical protein